MKQKTLGLLLLLAGITFSLSRGIFHIYVKYEYKNEIESYWSLADRASTIEQKSEYIDKFIKALDESNIKSTNNALFYPNDANSYLENMKALKSLQNRLHKIKTMDENSFSYQTAMQQVTEQELGGADEMLNVLYGCWKKDNYYTSWNVLICLSFLVIQFILIVVGYTMFSDY